MRKPRAESRGQRAQKKNPLQLRVEIQDGVAVASVTMDGAAAVDAEVQWRPMGRWRAAPAGLARKSLRDHRFFALSDLRYQPHDRLEVRARTEGANGVMVYSESVEARVS